MEKPPQTFIYIDRPRSFHPREFGFLARFAVCFIYWLSFAGLVWIAFGSGSGPAFDGFMNGVANRWVFGIQMTGIAVTFVAIAVFCSWRRVKEPWPYLDLFCRELASVAMNFAALFLCARLATFAHQRSTTPLDAALDLALFSVLLFFAYETWDLERSMVRKALTRWSTQSVAEIDPK